MHTLRTPSSFVASIMFPFVLSLPVMNAFCPVVFPSAMSTNVSSDRMIVTSGLSPSDFASPFFTVPAFFRSIVHDASFPAAFSTRNSNTPLFYDKSKLSREQDSDGTVQVQRSDGGWVGGWDGWTRRAPSLAARPSLRRCILQRFQRAPPKSRTPGK